jgi:hypothetical protein
MGRGLTLLVIAVGGVQVRGRIPRRPDAWTVQVHLAKRPQVGIARQGDGSRGCLDPLSAADPSWLAVTGTRASGWNTTCTGAAPLQATKGGASLESSIEIALRTAC